LLAIFEFATRHQSDSVAALMGNLYKLTATLSEIATRVNVCSCSVQYFASTIFPGALAPVVRRKVDGCRELVIARWGMPATARSVFEAAAKVIEKKSNGERTPLTFNSALRAQSEKTTAIIGDVRSLHWKKWLKVSNRCLVPFNAFAEPIERRGHKDWYGVDQSAPLGFLAGIFMPRQTRADDGVSDYAFGLLSATSARIQGGRRRKPLPIALTTTEEVDRWMTSSVEEALELRSRPKISKLDDFV
jgi:putative SOS response-associated peptidase YedK